MYRKLEDFIKDWQTESANTLKMMTTLTDASLPQKVSPEGRELGRIAWHITQSITEMGGRAGLKVAGPAEDAPVPENAAEITRLYEQAAKSLGEAIQGGWNDQTLLEEQDMYGEKWVNGFTLDVLLRHEIHHRAQMTVLMRQAGLQVPGVYGPSREEWAQFGMPTLP